MSQPSAYSEEKFPPTPRHQWGPHFGVYARQTIHPHKRKFPVHVSAKSPAHCTLFQCWRVLVFKKSLFNADDFIQGWQDTIRSKLKRARTDTSFVVIFRQFIFLKENGYISVIKPQVKQIRPLSFLSCQAYCTLDHTKLQHNNYC